jgi:tetratricopeptide (TPR) repeat protein
LDLDPHDKTTMELALGRYHEKQGDCEAAIRVIEGAIQKSPKNYNWHVALARTYYTMAKRVEGKGKRATKQRKLHRLKGIAQVNKYMRECDKQQIPPSSEARLKLGHFHACLGDMKKAMKEFDTLIMSSSRFSAPRRAFFHLERARCIRRHIHGAERLGDNYMDDIEASKALLAKDVAHLKHPEVESTLVCSINEFVYQLAWHGPKNTKWGHVKQYHSEAAWQVVKTKPGSSRYEDAFKLLDGYYKWKVQQPGDQRWRFFESHLSLVLQWFVPEGATEVTPEAVKRIKPLAVAYNQVIVSTESKDAAGVLYGAARAIRQCRAWDVAKATVLAEFSEEAAKQVEDALEMIELVEESSSTILVDFEEWKVMYRAHPSELITSSGGYRAKGPTAAFTAQQHVKDGGLDTQFMSFTSCLPVAVMYWIQKRGWEDGKDVRLLVLSTRYAQLRLKTAKGRYQMDNGTREQGRAALDMEVILEPAGGEIPREAVKWQYDLKRCYAESTPFKALVDGAVEKGNDIECKSFAQFVKHFSRLPQGLLERYRVSAS